jgi:hypothetical protein
VNCRTGLGPTAAVGLAAALLGSYGVAGSPAVGVPMPGRSAAPNQASLPYELVEVGQIGVSVTAVARSGTVLYVVESQTLGAYDVSVPASPQALGPAIRVPAVPRSVAAAGSVVLLAMGTSGLGLVDATDPRHLVYTTALDAGGAVAGVAGGDGLAYVAAGTGGLLIVDVSDPRRPSVVGRSPSRRPVVAVAVYGTTAYAAEHDAWEQVIRLVDVSDAAHPREQSFLDVPGLADRLVAAGSAVYVVVDGAGTVGHVRVLDVSDPGRPKTVPSASGAAGGSVTEQGASTGAPERALQAADAASARSVALDGDRLVVGYGTELASYLVAADRLHPTAAGTLQARAGVQSLALIGDVAAVASGAGGLLVVDVAPDPPRQVESLGDLVVGQPAALEKAGDRLYVADALGALRVMDVADPARPRPLWTWPTDSAPTDVAALGDYALVSQSLAVVRSGTTYAYKGGYEVVYLGGPSGPVRAAAGDLSCGVVALGVDGTRGYLAESNCVSQRQRTVAVLDLTNPVWPDELGSAVLSVHSPNDIVARGDVAYLAYAAADTPGGGLWVLDVSGNEPKPMGRATLPTEARAVALAGRHALVAAGASGLALLDVGDPQRPVVLDLLAVSGTAVDVAWDQGMAFVAGGDGGVTVWDVSVPAHPERAAHADTAGYASAVAVDGNRVFVGQQDGTIHVMDLRVAPTATPTPTETPAPTPTGTATEPMPTATSVSPATPVYLPAVDMGRP